MSKSPELFMSTGTYGDGHDILHRGIVALCVLAAASCDEAREAPTPRTIVVRQDPAWTAPRRLPTLEEERAITWRLRNGLLDSEPIVPARYGCTGVAFVPTPYVADDERVKAPGVQALRFHGREIDEVVQLDESQAGALVAILDDSGAYQSSCTLCSSDALLVRICCGDWSGDYVIVPSDAMSRVWTSGGEPPIEHLPLSFLGRMALAAWLQETLPGRSFYCGVDLEPAKILSRRKRPPSSRGPRLSRSRHSRR
ncbi:MAG: hypothetical protein U0166_16460 [Acidobacteriota bacterium]